MTASTKEFVGRLFAMAAILSLIIFAVAGCESKVEYKVVTQAERDEAVRLELHLPPNAKNIVKLDDDWHTFDLNLGGSNRSFLRRGHALGYESAVDTFTELNPK